MFTSYLPIFIAFFVLIICINNNHVSANNIYGKSSLNKNYDKLKYPINIDESVYLESSLPEDHELSRRGIWSRLFRNENSPTRMYNHRYYSPTASDHGYSNNPIHIIPFYKRTIPVELQKALYAHGIVGRRR